MSGDVRFRAGDVVVLTGEGWKPVTGEGMPTHGAVVTIDRGLWAGFHDGGLGMVRDPEGGEWFAWPDRDHIFGATLIHRPRHHGEWYVDGHFIMAATRWKALIEAARLYEYTPQIVRPWRLDDNNSPIDTED